MSISGFISRTKENLKKKNEARNNRITSNRMKELEELKIRKALLKEDSKLQRDLEKEKSEVKSLRKEKLRSGLAGKIFSNMKQKYKEEKSLDKGIYAKKSDSIFSNNQSYSNPFMQNKGSSIYNKGSFSSPMTKGNVGINPFTSSNNSEKPKEKKARVRIIEYR